MKKSFLYISLSLLTAALAGCSREETRPLTGGTLELTASVPYFDIETKAGGEFTDNITAYPLAGTALAADPVIQDYAAGGSYFFTIPAGTDNIVFSTVEAAPTAYTAAMDYVNGTISVSAAEGQPVGRDLIFGWLQSYTPGQTQASTDLRRASARLNVSLKSIYGVDTVSDLTSTIQSAEVAISGMHTSAVLNYKDLSYQYSGEGSVTFPLSPNEDSVYSAMIMTLPSVQSASAVLTLTVTSSDGTVRSYSSPLPSAISTNYSYSMNLMLSWDNTTSEFTLSDIQMSTTEMDGIPNQSFDLLKFSANSLTFRKESGSGSYVRITDSRLGTWTAEIPAEAFQHFAFRNNTNGTEATADSPVLTGEEGDELYIRTIEDNNTGGYLRYSIPFSVSDGDSTYTYCLDIIQSDGSMQSIEYTSEAYHYVSVSGENISYILFDDSGNADTLINGSSGISGNYSIGHYRICGEFITKLRIDDADLTSLIFNNCTMLNDLTTYRCSGDLSSIDLSSAENLEELDIDFNDTQITSIDLTHNPSLKNINIEINTLTELTLPPASENLEILSLSNAGNLTALNASGHTGLRELNLWNSMSALTSLDLSNCSSLTQISINSNMTNLSALSISGCTSLKKFDVWGEIPLESLDFTGCEFLDDIQLRYNPTIASITLPDARDLSYMLLDGLEALTELNTAGSNIDYLNLHNCDALQSLNLGQQSIRRLRVHSCDALTGLNMANNTSIRSLTSDANSSLAAIDLSSSSLDSLSITSCRTLSNLVLDGCSGLTYLYINNHSTPSISSDIPQISGLTGLQTLHLSYATVSNLDLKAMTSLKDVDIRYCNSLGTVDCSGLTNLSHFYLENTPASVLLTNCTGIDSLYVRDCENLNIDGASSLKYLRLVEINSEAFSEFNLNAPNIEELQIDDCDNLARLNVAEGNKLKKVYLNRNFSLKFKQTELNASSTLEELKIEFCSTNHNESIPRDSIDLSGYSALKFADIYNCNSYTYEASFEGCTSLTDLRLRNCSPLEHLTLTGCSALHSLGIPNNNLGSEELAAILDILPDRTGSANCLYYISGNPGSNDLSLIQTNIDNAKARGWYQSDNQLEELEFTFDFDYQ